MAQTFAARTKLWGGRQTLAVDLLSQHEATYGGQEVVVKMMGFSTAGLDRQTLARGMREISMLARASVTCRNVCQIVGYTTGEDTIGLVMRRYTRSLADEISAAGGPMAVSRVLRCVSRTVSRERSRLS